MLAKTRGTDDDVAAVVDAEEAADADVCRRPADRHRRRFRRLCPRRPAQGVAALVRGVLSLTSLLFFGPLAVYLGRSALRDDPGDGCARAGLVLGWVATALLLLAVAVAGGLLAAMLIAG
jgi:hypothetical protein